MRYSLFALLLWLGVASVNAQLIGLPPKPDLTAEGRTLIYEFETGGRSGYNPRPEWPGFQSGVTIGIGYDLGYNSRTVFLSDWRKHSAKFQLAETVGYKGIEARARLAQVKGILTAWDLATEVFDVTTLARFWDLTRRTFPGFDELEPNAQAALVSLVFNRGSSLVGPRRSEMATIRKLVPRRDYAGIARELRRMVRVWRGTDIERGMKRRREAEAALVETCIRK